MGLRFKKSFKIAPGIKVNVGKKSSSVTFGGKGAHYTVNSSGKRTSSVDIPGTGISYVNTSRGHSKGAKPQQSTSNSRSNMSSPSPNRNTKHKNKKASTARMIMFYLSFIFFVFVSLIGLILIINALSEDAWTILFSMSFIVIGITGSISTWKLARKEKYFLKHNEPYLNKTPKLFFISFLFILVLFVSAAFMPSSDSDSQAVKADEQQAESAEEESNTATEEEQTVTEQAESTEPEAAEVAEEPVQEEQATEQADEQSATAQEEQVTEQQDSNTAVESNTDVTVYITNTGSKYHTATCRTLKDSKIPISLSDAIGSYEPCGICHPPTN